MIAFVDTINYLVHVFIKQTEIDSSVVVYVAMVVIIFGYTGY